MAARADITKASGDLCLDRLVKRFGDFVAVDDLSLRVPQGSFFALLGPSGCGKTTTLRMVSGLDEPTSGRVRIGDADITDDKPYRRPVNTVFQNYALFPHMTVFENVAFGLRRRGIRDVDQQVRAALDLVELGDAGGRRPSRLSGGQQQRVAVARAIVNRPAVLLLDEPLGALDLKLRRQMQLELKRIQAEVGLTFVHVTHDQEEAMTMADTVAVMNNGVIEQLGPPAALYDFPHNAFVANFLGQSNLFPARIVGADGDEIWLEDVDGRFQMPRARLGPGVPARDGAKVLVGVRPEKIHIGPVGDDPGLPGSGGAGDRGNAVDGTVESSSFLGVSTQYQVRTRGGELIGVFAQNVDVGGLLAPGSQVRLTWAPRHGFVLGDAQGGADSPSLDVGTVAGG